MSLHAIVLRQRGLQCCCVVGPSRQDDARLRLAESAIHSDGLGLKADLPAADGARLDAVLFGEAQSRIVLSGRPDDAATLEATLSERDGVQAHRLGTVTDSGVRLTVGDAPVLDTDRAALAAPYEEAIPDAVS